MPENQKVKIYERKITPLERLFSRSPFSIVTVVARIKGYVSEKMLQDAVSKVQRRHTNLRVRITEDANHDIWFTSEGVKDIPVEIVPRESDDQWIQVFHKACHDIYEFEERPPIRFILVQSPTQSELIILCHHIICDGLSLAYLARDIMVYLGDPAREVKVLPDPVPIDIYTIPKKVTLNDIVKFFINRINKQWDREAVYFDQEDYRILHEAYWLYAKHQMITLELSRAETSALVDRCRKHSVTVNSALTTAMAGAQAIVQGYKPNHPSIGVAGSLRDRLHPPVGEVMGFYAGLITLDFKYNPASGFWDNTRRFHHKVTPLFTDKKWFAEPLLWCYLKSAIMESLNFKMLGVLIPPESTRYYKISEFAKRNDVVLSLLKRKKMDSLDRIFMGTAVTNLTRMDFPEKYGSLTLERLIMNPGGAFPLTMVNIVLGAVTCAGKLSLVIEYAEQNMDARKAEKIKEQVIEFLLEAEGGSDRD